MRVPLLIRLPLFSSAFTSWLTGAFNLKIDKSIAACGTHLRRFLDTCVDIAVPLASEKTEGPSQVLTFAGIELDCNKHEASLLRE